MSLPQRETLLAFIQGSAGLEWAQNRTGWKTDSVEPVCEWNHVKCDPVDDSVTSILLKNSGLYATIPTELFRLKSLVEMDLENNELRGTIPEGLLNELPELSMINLNSNNLDGYIPPIRSKLTNLVYFSMNKNRLYGTIQTDIGTLVSPDIIEHLDLSHNALTGSIPSSITNFQNMNYLDLSFNLLDGSIPKHVGDMKNLKGLFLNKNNLIGTIPPSMTRTDLKLIQIFLENNALSGTIPAGWSDLESLVDLFVDENKFTGTVPVDLCNENLNSQFFDDEIEVSERDGCTSISCPVSTVSREGVFPCSECKEQEFNPYLGLGGGHCFQMNEKRILDTLYDNTDGPNWKGGEGWRLDDVPACSYEGVSCSISGHIHSIKLSGMNLSGKIPQELGFLRNLNTLDLSDNHLTGYLSSDLRFAPIEALDISGNNLKGFVPPMLCLTGDINGNGNDGKFDCDYVACPVGSYNGAGHVFDRNDVWKGLIDNKCIPCESNEHFIGQKECITPTAKILRHSYEVFSPTKIVYIGLGGTFLCVLILCALVFKRMKDDDSLPGDVDKEQQSQKNQFLASYEDDNDNLDTLNLDKQSLNEDPNQSTSIEMGMYTTRVGRWQQHRGGSSLPFSMAPAQGRTIRDIFTSQTDEQVRKVITSDDEDIWDSRKVSENELWLDVPKII